MKRIRSSLNGTGFAIIAIAGVNLFLLLCLCVLLNTHRLPRYGVSVRPAESHFVIGNFDRSCSHILTITPGDTPRFFLEEKEVKGGLDGVEALLKEWDSPNPERVVIVLVCDEAVSVGTVQQVTDRVLLHGFTCAFSGRPPVANERE